MWPTLFKIIGFLLEIFNIRNDLRRKYLEAVAKYQMKVGQSVRLGKGLSDDLKAIEEKLKEEEHESKST